MNWGQKSERNMVWKDQWTIYFERTGHRRILYKTTDNIKEDIKDRVIKHQNEIKEKLKKKETDNKNNITAEPTNTLK